MLRGTTPTVTLTLPEEFDLSGVTVAYMSFGQKELEVFSVPKSRITMEANAATATLTQEETLQLSSNYPTKIQLRWLKGGVAYGTKAVSVDTDEIIKDGVIS